MNATDIAQLVQAVIKELGASSSSSAESQPVSGVAAPDLLSLSLDLGSEDARGWLGVKNPSKPDAAVELQRSTRARVCSGRAGTRPRTQSMLRFLADHARSKGTVLSEVPIEWVSRVGLVEVQSQITSKDLYLTRPDLGRKLSEESFRFMKSECIQAPDVQVLISDGLSTEATLVNYENLVPPLLRGLETLGIKVGTPVFVRFGRVKIEDQIGELLQAKLVILLIGERPGLGQSESLSCYMVYSPTSNTVEADRTCLSNIHQGGTPPVEAAAVIVEMAERMLREKASGVHLGKLGGG